MTYSMQPSVVTSLAFPVCCSMAPIFSKILYKVAALQYPGYGPYSFRIMSLQKVTKNSPD